MDNYYINKILEEKKITTFLEERGIYPAKKSGDKLIYHCPIHTGDNDPSFMVYGIGTKGRNYQTYYCFGCHAGINIINLKSDLDKISFKDTIKSFLKDIDIDKKSIMESIINDIQNMKLIIEENQQIEILLLLINTVCKSHLKGYTDEEEKLFFDIFFKKLDDVARAKDIDTIKKIYSILIEGKGLEKRVEKFQKRQEEKDLSLVSWKI